MKLRSFIVNIVFSCIFAETFAISAFSRHDEGTTEGLTTSSISTTTQHQQFASSSSVPGESFISSTQDFGDSSSFTPSQYAGVVTENDDAKTTIAASEIPFSARQLELGASSIVKMLDENIAEKVQERSPVTAPRLIKFVDDEVSPTSTSSAESKKFPRSYYGEFGSHSQPFPHTSIHSREQSVLGNQNALQQQQHPIVQPQHQPQILQQQHQIVEQQHHYPIQMPEAHFNYNHGTVVQGQGHSTVPYLPDVMNEISNHYPVHNTNEIPNQYPVHKEVSQYQHQHTQENHYPRPPIVLSKGKHIRAQVGLETPPIVYQPGHNTATAHASHGKDNSPYFGPAFSKALKFWIPSAIFLTGVSALFPHRVKVHTTEQDEINSRPKRSTRYNNGQSDYESIPAVLLRREHRSDNPSDGDEIHDYEDLTDPYYQHAEPQRLRYPESLPLPKEEIESFRKSVPLAEIENYQSNIPKLVENLHSLGSFPTFKPMPESGNKGSTNPYITFDFLQTSEAPTTAGSITAKSTKEPFVQKTSPKPPALPKIAGTPKPTAAGTKQKTEGRKVFVVVRSNAVPPVPATTSATFAEVQTTVNSPTTSTTNASLAVDATDSTPTANNATAEPSPKTGKFISSQNDPVVTESQKNSVSVKAPTKDVQNQKNKYDLSPDGPVIGLLSSVVEHNEESLSCQKRALCELAIRGTDPKATRFETFMWTLATLVPDAFTFLYDLEDVFKAIREKKCPETFPCLKPNLDIQE